MAGRPGTADVGAGLEFYTRSVAVFVGEEDVAVPRFGG